MRILRNASAGILVLGLVAVFAAPIGPLPGFFIGGTPTVAPATWEDTSQIDEILLKAPGTIPRVVIIWVVEYDEDLYVLGMKESGWTRRIGGGAPVEVRIGDKTYSVRATPVQDDAGPIYEAYKAKYEANYPDLVAQMPEIEEAAGFAVVLRLGRTAR